MTNFYRFEVDHPTAISALEDLEPDAESSQIPKLSYERYLGQVKECLQEQDIALDFTEEIEEQKKFASIASEGLKTAGKAFDGKWTVRDTRFYPVNSSRIRQLQELSCIDSAYRERLPCRVHFS